MKQEINLTPTAPSRYHDYEATCWENGHEKGVEVGIAYQKEQDKELIEELLTTLKEISDCRNRISYHSDKTLLDFVTNISKIAITKTENYLKQ